MLLVIFGNIPTTASKAVTFNGFTLSCHSDHTVTNLATFLQNILENKSFDGFTLKVTQLMTTHDADCCTMLQTMIECLPDTWWLSSHNSYGNLCIK